MRGIRRLGRAAGGAAVRWVDERCATLAAAVAFFAASSLAPMLVIVVAVGGVFFGPEAVRGQLVGQLRGLIGEDGARAVQGLVQSAWRSQGSGGVKTALSVATPLVGASATFAELSEGETDVDLAARHRSVGCAACEAEGAGLADVRSSAGRRDGRAV